MFGRVRDYIEENHMLEGIGRVVVGLSGGADSVCLLLMLQKYISEAAGSNVAELIAVHVHHGIRGADADADAEFCRRLCSDKGIEYREYCFDVPRLADERSIGEEEMGRLLRYQAFRENIGGLPDGRKGVIAVAHHQNDQAETVLFHIARGSSVAGGRGMEPVAGDIIRPLLCISRREIEGWLAGNGIAYCTDKTNYDDTYVRNAIRLKVIPYLEEHVNDGAVANICRYAQRMSAVDDYLKHQTAKVYGRCVTEDKKGIHISDKLKNEHIVIINSVIYSVLKKLCGAKDLEDKHVAACATLFDRQCGRSINLPKNIEAKREYGGIVLTDVCNNKDDADSREAEYELFGSVISIKSDNVYEDVQYAQLVEDIIDKNLMIDNCTKYFDYGKIKHYIAESGDTSGLVARHRVSGDYMIIGYAEPEHRELKKKLKEILIEAKVPADSRGEVWLCVIGNRVLWAAGVRRCADFTVDRDTTELLKLELKQKEK